MTQQKKTEMDCTFENEDKEETEVLEIKETAGNREKPVAFRPKPKDIH